MKEMTLKDFINLRSNDDNIDIYLDGWDEEYPTHVKSDSKFTQYALDKYKDVLEREVVAYEQRGSNWWAVWLKEPEGTSEEDFEKISNKINIFCVDTAGYCSCSEYDKIYGEGDYANGPVFDDHDIRLKYGIDLDVDFLGGFYDLIKEKFESNPSKEEFEKFLEDISTSKEEFEKILEDIRSNTEVKK